MSFYVFLQVPVLFKADNNTVATDIIAQDPVSKLWYKCPDFFKVSVCMNCKGPRLRCHSDFGFAFR